MKGVYDCHIHASPSIFERWGTAEQTAERCQAAGMAGIVLKAHHGSTVELANHLDGKFTLDIFGGVVLNYFVGGLNPYAAEVLCALDGKFLWLPTIHAAAHKPLGRFEFQEPKTRRIPLEGIRITDKNDLVKPMYQILEILHDKKVVLATGHLSAEEIKTLVRTVKKQTYHIPILINHIRFFTPALDEEDIEVLKGDNVWFELSYLTQIVQAGQTEKVAQIIRRHPDAKWVMVSDSGQKTNIAPQALKSFRDLLLDEGIKSETLQKMMIDTPKQLLY